MKKNYPSHKENGLFWLYGQHAVEAALQNPIRKKIKIKSVKPLLDSFTQHIPTQIVSRAEIEALCPEGAVHQGIALQVAPLPLKNIEEILSENKKQDVLLILDQVTDPHNIGAILRSAAAFDASAVIIADSHAPQETSTLVKSSCGGIEIVPLIRVPNLARAMELIKKNGYWILGLDGKAKGTITQGKLPEKTAFVLGSEGSGLRRLTEENCDTLIKLPISPKMESLNVSNAAAIALYEYRRVFSSV